MKIHTNDTVVVISGNNKGATGKVLKTYPDKDMVLVENVNQFNRHVRPQPGVEGRIRVITKPMHVSKVAVVEPRSKRSSKIGYMRDKDGNKYRVFKKTGKKIEYSN